VTTRNWLNILVGPGVWWHYLVYLFPFVLFFCLLFRLLCLAIPRTITSITHLAESLALCPLHHSPCWITCSASIASLTLLDHLLCIHCITHLAGSLALHPLYHSPHCTICSVACVPPPPVLWTALHCSPVHEGDTFPVSFLDCLYCSPVFQYSTTLMNRLCYSSDAALSWPLQRDFWDGYGQPCPVGVPRASCPLLHFALFSNFVPSTRFWVRNCISLHGVVQIIKAHWLYVLVSKIPAISVQHKVVCMSQLGSSQHIRWDISSLNCHTHTKG